MDYLVLYLEIWNKRYNLSTIYFEKWSQTDFADVNSGGAGGGIICRMLLIDFHRRRGLPEFSEVASANYFDLASVIILLHSDRGIGTCNENDLGLYEICAMVARAFWRRVLVCIISGDIHGVGGFVGRAAALSNEGVIYYLFTGTYFVFLIIIIA